MSVLEVFIERSMIRQVLSDQEAFDHADTSEFSFFEREREYEQGAKSWGEGRGTGRERMLRRLHAH